MSSMGPDASAQEEVPVETQWQIINNAINLILEDKSNEVSFEQTYQSIYLLCVRGYDEELGRCISSSLQHHIRSTILPIVNNAVETENETPCASTLCLEAVASQFFTYATRTQKISSLFMFYNRILRSGNIHSPMSSGTQHKSVYDMSIDIYRTTVITVELFNRMIEELLGLCRVCVSLCSEARDSSELRNKQTIANQGLCMIKILLPEFNVNKFIDELAQDYGKEYFRDKDIVLDVAASNNMGIEEILITLAGVYNDFMYFINKIRITDYCINTQYVSVSIFKILADKYLSHIQVNGTDESGEKLGRIITGYNYLETLLKERMSERDMTAANILYDLIITAQAREQVRKLLIDEFVIKITGLMNEQPENLISTLLHFMEAIYTHLLRQVPSKKGNVGLNDQFYKLIVSSLSSALLNFKHNKVLIEKLTDYLVFDESVVFKSDPLAALVELSTTESFFELLVAKIILYLQTTINGDKETFEGKSARVEAIVQLLSNYIRNEEAVSFKNLINDLKLANSLKLEHGSCVIRPLVFRGTTYLQEKPADIPSALGLTGFIGGQANKIATCVRKRVQIDIDIDVLLNGWMKLRWNTKPPVDIICPSVCGAILLELEQIQKGNKSPVRVQTLKDRLGLEEKQMLDAISALLSAQVILRAPSLEMVKQKALSLSMGVQINERYSPTSTIVLQIDTQKEEDTFSMIEAIQERELPAFKPVSCQAWLIYYLKGLKQTENAKSDVSNSHTGSVHVAMLISEAITNLAHICTCTPEDVKGVLEELIERGDVTRVSDFIEYSE